MPTQENEPIQPEVDPLVKRPEEREDSPLHDQQRPSRPGTPVEPVPVGPGMDEEQRPHPDNSIAPE
jgi:hypothetical protein